MTVVARRYSKRTLIILGGELPPMQGRWTAARKERVLLAVMNGRLTSKEAAERYRLSDDELARWVERYGVAGRRGLALIRTHESRASQAGGDL